MRYLIVTLFLFSVISISILIGSDVTDVEAKTGSSIWKDDFNYSSLSGMENAGWTSTNRDGVSFGSNGVILNGSSQDTAIHHASPTNIIALDWKVEVRVRWLGLGHSGLNVFVYTQNHSYGLSADGYYNIFKLYRDDRTAREFGSYTEKKGEWVTISMVKRGDTISLFFQGKFIERYVEQLSPNSKLMSIGMISPWRGNSEYDYVKIDLPKDDGSSDGIFGLPTPLVLIGGGLVGALVAGGGVVAYILLSGGSAGTAAAGSSATTGGAIAATPPASVTPPVTATPPSPATTTGTGSPVQTTQGSGAGPDVQPFQDLHGTVPSTESLESPMDQGPQDSGTFWQFFQDLWTSLWGS